MRTRRQWQPIRHNERVDPHVLIRRPTGWLRLERPTAQIVAREPAAVIVALDEADRAAQRGDWVAGFVTYEAAAAFDLPVHAAPLAGSSRAAHGCQRRS